MTFLEKFEAAMEDDFNTADAISAVFELVKLANSTAWGTAEEYIETLKANIATLTDVLGINVEKKRNTGFGYRKAYRRKTAGKKG